MSYRQEIPAFPDYKDWGDHQGAYGVYRNDFDTQLDYDNAIDSALIDTIRADQQQYGMHARPSRMPRSTPLPEGWKVEQRDEPDPYERSNNRDYHRISFGTLLSEDYGRLIRDDMPLGVRDDNPAPRHPSPAEGRWREHFDRSMQYTRLLRSMKPADAATLGIDIDLLFPERERDFCQSFLGFMAYLGHQGAERFQLGNLPKAADMAKAIGQLTTRLTPARWKQAPGNDRDWSNHVEDKPFTADYRRLIREVAAGSTSTTDPKSVRAYPLHKLNPSTLLYLCEDGKIRARVNSQVLLPAPAATSNHAPTCNLAVDFDPPRQDGIIQHITHEVVTPDGSRRPFRARTYSPRVLAYPAKQRLVDIAGRALAQRATQGA